MSAHEYGLPEDALLERIVVRRTDEVVELREVWDMTHPRCPFVSVVFRDTFPRKVEMTPEEYTRRKKRCCPPRVPTCTFRT